MKRKKLARLSRNLGSTIQGVVNAPAGYFGALQLAESVRRRFQTPARGGRARDRGWTLKRLIPVRPETLVRLEKLAAEVSELVDYRVEPLQVAALLIERDLESLSDDEEGSTRSRCPESSPGSTRPATCRRTFTRAGEASERSRVGGEG